MSDTHTHSHSHDGSLQSESNSSGAVHSHSHSHHHDYSEANKNHFDEAKAENYDKIPGALKLSDKVGKAMRAAAPELFYEDENNQTLMMDFACGTGLISRVLASYTKKIWGVDSSQAMVNQYNKVVYNQGVDEEEMKAVCMELKGTEDELKALGDKKFDVITCSMAYHHFDSIDNMTKTLAFFLKPGGKLMIADILKEHAQSSAEDPYAHIVAHHGGFDKADIENIFLVGGFDEPTFTNVVKAKMPGRPDEPEVQIFLAYAAKKL